MLELADQRKRGPLRVIRGRAGGSAGEAVEFEYELSAAGAIVLADGGEDLQAAEPGEAFGPSRLRGGCPTVQHFAGGLSLADRAVVDRDREPFAAGVGAPLERVGN